MSEWQPIDTAPKDGTAILLHATIHSMLYSNPQRVVGWWDRGWWCCAGALSHPEAWQPLPEPPPMTEQLYRVCWRGYRTKSGEPHIYRSNAHVEVSLGIEVLAGIRALSAYDTWLEPL